MKLKSFFLTASIALSVGQIGALQAHDAWISTQGPAHAVLYGHGDKGDPYDTAKIKDVRAYDAKGKPVDVEISRAEKEATIEPKSKAAVLALEFDNGYWSKGADGKSRNESKQVTGAEQGTKSLKFGKTILAWSEAATRPVGQRLELVPLSGAAPADHGAVAVQLLFDGQPLPGAKVMLGGHDDEKPATTDAEGKASVEVHKGVQSISAGHSVPHDGPEADTTRISTNLVFEVR